jgi:hypothetical protein
LSWQDTGEIEKGEERKGERHRLGDEMRQRQTDRTKEQRGIESEQE